MSNPLSSARRRVPALLAGTALAAASAASAGTALLNVSVVIEPRCAVSAPSRIERAPAITAEPSDILAVACTNGASYAVETTPEPAAAAVLAPDAAPTDRLGKVHVGATPVAAPSTTHAPGPAGLVRITVRY